MSDTAPDTLVGNPNADTLLTVEGLNGWYGESHVLHGIDFDVSAGEVVTLLGRNGAGKTSTLSAIMGLLGKRTGSVRFGGTETIHLQPRHIARLGIALCPEERGIFSSLNVEENLMLPPRIADGGLTVERIYQLFPNLLERRRSQGTKLSGGEQQMLAIGRALLLNPKLLVMDEPTEGLAPVINDKLGRLRGENGKDRDIAELEEDEGSRALADYKRAIEAADKSACGEAISDLARAGVVTTYVTVGRPTAAWSFFRNIAPDDDTAAAMIVSLMDAYESSGMPAKACEAALSATTPPARVEARARRCKKTP